MITSAASKESALLKARAAWAAGCAATVGEPTAQGMYRVITQDDSRHTKLSRSRST